jgi:hypothetical protein
MVHGSHDLACRGIGVNWQNCYYDVAHGPLTIVRADVHGIWDKLRLQRGTWPHDLACKGLWRL